MATTPLSALQPFIDYCKQPGPPPGRLLEQRALYATLGVRAGPNPDTYATSAYYGSLMYMATTVPPVFSGALTPVTTDFRFGPTKFPLCALTIFLNDPISIVVMFPTDLTGSSNFGTGNIDGHLQGDLLFESPDESTGYSLILTDGGVVKVAQLVSGLVRKLGM